LRSTQIPRQSLTRQLFFKALKQTAKVKSFLGTSANAVKTQIWTALIAMLILKYLQMKSSFGWSLSNLAALLRQQLFIFRDLWAWLNDPLALIPTVDVELTIRLVERDFEFSAAPPRHG